MNLDALHLAQHLNRRHFLARSGVSLGAMALGARAKPQAGPRAARSTSPPEAKRVIYLFQSGAPSQIDLFDYKPALKEKRGIELPDSASVWDSVSPR